MESYYFPFGNMSKIGQKIISVPSSVQVDMKGKEMFIKGKAGELNIVVPKELTVVKNNDTIEVKRNSENKKVKSLHGLYRSLIANAVTGVEEPWKKRMEVVGTGYNVKLQGEEMIFKVGYSHQVVFKKVEGIQFQVEGNNKVIISGVDKQLVGQTAHQVKIIKKPDPYKGKGIRYEGEKLRIKPGKKAKTTA